MTQKHNPKRRKKRNRNTEIQRNQGPSSSVPTQPSKQPDGSTRQLITAEHHLFSGPLPPPEVIKQYDSIIPNGAERIMAMAESQSQHRQQLEKQALEAEVEDKQQQQKAEIEDDRNQRKETRIGQLLGFLIVFVALVACVVIAIYVPWPASAITSSIIGGGSLINLAYAFRYGRGKKTEQPGDKGGDVKS